MSNDFGQYENIVPLLAPVDKAANAWATPWVDLKAAHKCRFYLFTGLLTSASADTAAVTIEASPEAGSDSEAAIAFNYRISGAVAANTWGAITAATATGFNLSTATDGLMYQLDVDPAVAQATGRFVRMVIGSWSDTISAALVAAWAEVTPRYLQTTMVSTTGAT